MTTDEREAILAALQKLVRSRPGFDFANYGNLSAYRADVRVATRQLNHAETMLATIGWRGSITAEDLKHAMRRAFSGRLSWDGKALSYCAGQYYPMEFRAAVCAVLASVLWDYWRRNDPNRSADAIRKLARSELSSTVVREWFR